MAYLHASIYKIKNDLYSERRNINVNNNNINKSIIIPSIHKGLRDEINDNVGSSSRETGKDNI